MQKTNPKKVQARKMMTQREISRGTSPFDSAAWRNQRDAKARKELKKRGVAVVSKKKAGGSLSRILGLRKK